jgi:hypothetical protein
MSAPSTFEASSSRDSPSRVPRFKRCPRFFPLSDFATDSFDPRGETVLLPDLAELAADPFDARRPSVESLDPRREDFLPPTSELSPTSLDPRREDFLLPTTVLASLCLDPRRVDFLPRATELLPDSFDLRRESFLLAALELTSDWPEPRREFLLS